MLEYDTSRVWFEDTECVDPEFSRVYEEAFARWSAISRAAFLPSGIEETWAGPEHAQVTVRMKLDDGTLTLTPIIDNDWFDLTTMNAINIYIRKTGIQFYLFDQTLVGQQAFIVALSEAEKRTLELQRDWKFTRDPTIPNDEPCCDKSTSRWRSALRRVWRSA